MKEKKHISEFNKPCAIEAELKEDERTKKGEAKFENARTTNILLRSPRTEKGEAARRTFFRPLCLRLFPREIRTARDSLCPEVEVVEFRAE